ncbi:acyl-CoA dehydrogenase family protein [Streptomyces cylindrosporus]|uniref:Acyl-CoA/acyl-ACP dehydrogenase n=1 Tax=Streptomyces cylindrosporus TaxID=2927583 RepID=A0ABS9YKY6_9ACTN|nr:acyl-CoA dehydrogenase family protein [Streptomyces cylindrosporus]MCI3277932.1 acyl-CoA/acyl-ACP dehydrogenase [Streptomyces cylindrosporus]
MALTFTEEHTALRSTLRRFLTDKAPSEAVRRAMESEEGHDPRLWQQMAGQLGLHGLPLPQEYGGFGGGPVELGIVLEELGRALLPSPYFATVALAGQALAASGDEAAKARWLPAIADGSLTGTLALAEESGSWNIDDVTAEAVHGDAAWRVSGTKMFVIDGHSADLLLVVARSADGPGLYAVDGTAAGVSRARLETLDPTRRLARVDLDGAPATRVGPEGDATAFLRTVTDLAAVALAAEQVGGAQACLDASVEYAKTRVQFGRPIGSFQAIKHKCADMLLKVEAARSAAYHALSVAADTPDELPVSAALAAAYCADAHTHAAKENIQIHGGIGYTWEHDAHLHLKRAKSSEQLFGSPATHRGRLAELVGISPATATKG